MGFTCYGSLIFSNGEKDWEREYFRIMNMPSQQKALSLRTCKNTIWFVMTWKGWKGCSKRGPSDIPNWTWFLASQIKTSITEYLILQGLGRCGWVISDKLQTSDERPDLIFCLLAFWHSMSCLREWQRVISHCTLYGVCILVSPRDWQYMSYYVHLQVHPRLCMISGYEMDTPQMYVSKCWRPKNSMKMVDSSAKLPFPGSLFWNIPELFLAYNIQWLHWDTVSFHIKSRWHTSNDDERDIERSPGEGITSMKPS